MNPNSGNSHRSRTVILVTGLALIIGVWFFREPLRQKIREKATLANDAPAPEAVAEMIEQSANPAIALMSAWNSGKTVHREAAIRSFSQVLPAKQALSPAFDSLLLSAALDPDMNVRESTLGILRERNHPALPALAAEQLRDCDQQARLLGLTYLKSATPMIGVPTMIPLLDDPDPMIVTLTLKALENWSGEKFGVNLSETASFENSKTGLKEFREGSQAKAKAGADRAKAWWAAHQGQFPPAHLEVPPEAFAARRRLPASDFQLLTLEGQNVRLSDFRGKIVLINFWTTWCTACVSEMPELIALQRKHASNLVILGISLDHVPDSHGHIGGHPSVEEQSQAGSEQDDHEANAAALKQVREKVARTVKIRGINYSILLDEKNEVGVRFNGGELPTTVIVDAQGNIRRRFIGARSLPVFEAMIAEAGKTN